MAKNISKGGEHRFLPLLVLIYKFFMHTNNFYQFYMFFIITMLFVLYTVLLKG